MHITCVVGARPNFMKMAPILRSVERFSDMKTALVHTGQHYDSRMSDLFFDELGLPEPDIHLGIGSGNHAVQTARVMTAFDEVLEQFPTDMVVVVGDVNSTLACALVTVKRLIPIAHVEAGLRSGDRSMPEEINRLVTDQISDLLFLTEESARNNLLREGIDPGRIHFVGNVMIDSLLAGLNAAKNRHTPGRLGLTEHSYAVCTLHRPSNVDSLESARNTVRAVDYVRQALPTVWPVHPRTRARLGEFDLLPIVEGWKNLILTEPMGYLDFLGLTSQARVVFTDSGGLQEETTALRVPCLTFRENTERPITITDGSNQLVGTDPERVRTALHAVLNRAAGMGKVPDLWDGKAGDRIVAKIREHLT